MADYSEQRDNMVERQLLPGEVIHPLILSAAGHIPREKFLPEDKKYLAYLDSLISLDNSHYMLRPTDLMLLIQALDIKPTDRVLDIGCTNGYSSFVISCLAQQVIGLEDQEQYITRALDLVDGLRINNAEFVLGSYSLGYQDKGRYDAILVQQAYSRQPEMLLEQLAEGGRLVYIQQEDEHYGRAILIEKNSYHYSERVLFELCLPYFNNCQEFIF